MENNIKNKTMLIWMDVYVFWSHK